MREIFRSSPRELRDRRRRADRLATDGGLALRLPFEPPFDWDAIVGFLAAHAIPGVESVESGVYRRTIVLDGDPGMLEIQSGASDHLLLGAHLPHWEGLIHVVERAGRVAGVDTDVSLAHTRLAGDALLGPLVAARPGLRVPGSWAPLEVGVHAIVSQALDLAETRTALGALVQACGLPIPGLGHGLTHAFPSAATLARSDLSALGIPQTTAEAVRAYAGEVAAGALQLDGGVSLDQLVSSLTAIPGIGSAAAQHLAARLGERDAFPAADARLREALLRLDPTLADAAVVAERWRPWRALAAMHLELHAAESK
jgi:AraC family transcriptional regulator of adaptative response / DNA-3-methyladenine glycosylase II